MAARLEAPWAGALPVTAAAPARQAVVAWPRLPAAAELAATGAGYAGYDLVRLRWLVSPHWIRLLRSTGRPWRSESRVP
jgi:hypothetical protein